MARRIERLEIAALALAVGQLLPWTPSTGTTLLLATAGALLGASLVEPRVRSGLVWVALVGGCLVTGAALATWRHRIPSDPQHLRRLELPWRGEVEALVHDGPWRAGERVRLTVDVVATRRGGPWRPARGRVRVGVYGPPPSLRPGDRIRARMSLREPRGFRSPGSFDWVGYLARRGIHVTGSISSAADLRVVGSGIERHAGPGRIERWRSRVAARIDRLPESEARAVLLALVVGHRGEVSPELRDRFVRAGVAHVLAISGLHVGIVAWVWALGVASVLLRIPMVAARGGARSVAVVLACVPAALYCGLGGLGPSVLRAAAALLVLAFAAVFDRRPGGVRVTAIVTLVLGAVEPGMVRDVGMQLSLVAVLGLVVGVEKAGRGRIARVLGASAGAWLATAPLLAHHFQEVSLVAPVVAPLLLPFFGLGPIALGVAGAFAEPVSGTLAGACFVAARWLLEPGLRLVETVAAVPGVSMRVPRPSAGEVAGLYAVIALLVATRMSRRRVLLAVATIAALGDVAWWTSSRAGSGALRVAFLDVGQGDAAVVELPDGGVIVVDAGGLPGGSLDVGRAVVDPYLRSRKIGRIDLVVATHAHPDHHGGLASVVSAFRPREVWWPGVGGGDLPWRRLEAATQRTGSRMRVVGAGTRLETGGATVRVLHPGAAMGLSHNDASIVLEIRWGGRRVLLTGDVEREGERRLIARGVGPADLVKVAHHGSRTSSTPAFVRSAAPAVAVISAGHANRYGHPAPEVEARWRAGGTCVLRTDRCGTVVVTITRERVTTRAVDPGCGCPALRAPARSPS